MQQDHHSELVASSSHPMFVAKALQDEVDNPEAPNVLMQFCATQEDHGLSHRCAWREFVDPNVSGDSALFSLPNNIHKILLGTKCGICCGQLVQPEAGNADDEGAMLFPKLRPVVVISCLHAMHEDCYTKTAIPLITDAMRLRILDQQVILARMTRGDMSRSPDTLHFPAFTCNICKTDVCAVHVVPVPGFMLDLVYTLELGRLRNEGFEHMVIDFNKIEEDVNKLGVDYTKLFDDEEDDVGPVEERLDFVWPNASSDDSEPMSVV